MPDTSNQRSWEGEFEHMERNHGWIPEHKERMIAFIRQVEDKAFGEGYDEGLNANWGGDKEIQLDQVRQEERKRLIEIADLGILVRKSRSTKIDHLEFAKEGFQAGWKAYREELLSTLSKEELTK